MLGCAVHGPFDKMDCLRRVDLAAYLALVGPTRHMRPIGKLDALGLDDGIALHKALVGIYGAELGARQFVHLGGCFFMEARQGVSGDYDTLVIMNTVSVAATFNSV